MAPASCPATTNQNRSHGMSENATRRTRDAARPTRRAKSPRQTRRPVETPPSRPAALDRVGEAVRRGAADPRSAMAAHRVPLIVAGVALVLIVALYGPTCGLYQAWRENGVLQAEQARASEESAELESDINTLMTEDGIKDEARRRGYVEEGETRIVVDGAEQDEDASDDVQPDETPWYLSVADFIFQYHED